MTDVDHFSYGLLTPVAAYTMACVGSLLGLLCTARAQRGSHTSRVSWLVLGAIAIGGTGVWVMHFIAMLGFRVSGVEIRYDVPLTLASALIAVVVVGIGLSLVGFRGTGLPTLAAGGLITGIGVATMHYMGMVAMNMSADVDYGIGYVALSIVIAVVAATAALWFSVRVRGMWSTLGAALVMGLAVGGMHYTGMAGMHVHAHDTVGTPDGARVFDILPPLIIGISVIAVVLLLVIGISPSEDEIAAEQELRDRARARDTERDRAENLFAERPYAGGPYIGGLHAGGPPAERPRPPAPRLEGPSDDGPSADETDRGPAPYPLPPHLPDPSRWFDEDR